MPKLLFSFVAIFVLLLIQTNSDSLAKNNDITASDQIKQLYSSRITFNENGIPEVGIGLMDSKQEIFFKAETGIRATLHNGKTTQISVILAEPFSVRLKHSTSGTTVYHVIVDTLDSFEKHLLNKRIEHWNTNGIETKVLRTGSIISLGGKVINNMQYHLSVRSFSSKSEAKKYAATLKNEKKVAASVLSKIDKIPTGVLALIDSDGEELATSKDLLVLNSIDQHPLTVLDLEYGQGFAPGTENRSYDGKLYVTFDKDGNLSLGNLVSLETLLMGTVASEIFPTAPLDALKAQAIAARGQLLAKLGQRHLAEPYHLCQTQHCQVYKGTKTKTKKTDQAIRETHGLFLMENDMSDTLVDTTYASSCGGHSENNENVWHQLANKHQRGKPDSSNTSRFTKGITDDNIDDFLNNSEPAYCEQSGYPGNRFRWNRLYTSDQVDQMIAKKYKVGHVLNLVPQKRGISGRLIELMVVGSTKIVVISKELAIRRLLGNLPSALIKINKQLDADGTLEAFYISGAGFGHGVGMCQHGAIGRAKAGQDFKQILQHYYNGASLEKLY